MHAVARVLKVEEFPRTVGLCECHEARGFGTISPYRIPLSSKMIERRSRVHVEVWAHGETAGHTEAKHGGNGRK